MSADPDQAVAAMAAVGAAAGDAGELVDLDRLGAWLDAQGLAPGRPLTVEPLTGGTSNAMFVVRRGDQEWVLRRPAKVAVARANEGMRREHRMLVALDATGVPHPRAVALCEDHAVLGCTFHLMERVHGTNPAPWALPEALDTAEGRRGVTFALVDALAALHDVDWRGAGLGDLDRTDGFHERQVARWSGQLESYGGRDLPGTRLVGPWLEAHLPGPFEPTIMHGDYHMLNVMIAPTPPARVVAILDWETSTIGDPLLDLAGFCEIWTPQTDPAQGWPTRTEIVARYRDARHLPAVPDLRYHEVLYNFRMTVLLEGIYQRSLQDPGRPAMDVVGERALGFLDRAVALVGEHA